MFKKEDDDSKDNIYYTYLTLARHIRNSIAHGRTYINKDKRKKIFLFVDFNKNGNITAKIICTQTDLNRWRKLIRSCISISKNMQ